MKIDWITIINPKSCHNCTKKSWSINQPGLRALYHWAALCRAWLSCGGARRASRGEGRRASRGRARRASSRPSHGPGPRGSRSFAENIIYVYFEIIWIYAYKESNHVNKLKTTKSVYILNHILSEMFINFYDSSPDRYYNTLCYLNWYCFCVGLRSRSRSGAKTNQKPCKKYH